MPKRKPETNTAQPIPAEEIIQAVTGVGLDNALISQGIEALANSFRMDNAEWPPVIVEWVERESGELPEQGDPLKPYRTRFQIALYYLLKEKTGYDFEAFNNMTGTEFVTLAEITANIEARRRGDSQQATDKKRKSTATVTETDKKKKRRPPAAPIRKLCVHYLHQDEKTPDEIFQTIDSFIRDVLENNALDTAENIFDIQNEVKTWRIKKGGEMIITKYMIENDLRYIGNPENLRNLQDKHGQNSVTIEAFKEWL